MRPNVKPPSVSPQSSQPSGGTSSWGSKRKVNIDTIQVDKKMTKDSRDHSHYEQSSQQTSQNPTNDLMDLTRGRTGHRLEHQMFFLLVLLNIKHVVNNLGSF